MKLKRTPIQRVRLALGAMLVASLLPAALPPQAEAQAATDSAIWVGYGNLGPMPYDPPSAATKRQLDFEANKITTMGVSLFVALELHDKPLAYFKTKLPGNWKAAGRPYGGNVLLYDAGKYQILSEKSEKLGTKDGRGYTKWNLQRISSGLKFWVVGYHAPAGDRSAQRKEQMKLLLQKTSTLHRVVYGIDKNSCTKAAGYPSDMLKKAGITSIYDAVPNLPGSDRDSHHSTTKHNPPCHIDFLGSGSLARFTSGEQINSRGSAWHGIDHDWLKGRVVIKGM